MQANSFTTAELFLPAAASPSGSPRTQGAPGQPGESFSGHLAAQQQKSAPAESAGAEALAMTDQGTDRSGQEQVETSAVNDPQLGLYHQAAAGINTAQNIMQQRAPGHAAGRPNQASPLLAVIDAVLEQSSPGSTGLHLQEGSGQFAMSSPLPPGETHSSQLINQENSSKTLLANGSVTNGSVANGVSSTQPQPYVLNGSNSEPGMLDFALIGGEKASTGGPVIVEEWTATFSPREPGTLQEALAGNVKQGFARGQAAAGEQAMPVTQLQLPTAEGQRITVYQSSEQEEMAARMIPAGQTAHTTLSSGQRLDATGNYLHSKMPSNDIQATLQPDAEQQFGEEQKQPGKGAAPALQPDQLKGPDATAPREGQPILFSTDPATTTAVTGQQTTSTVAPEVTTMRLPSGLTVQEGTVMDQVINHFQANRKLESSSIRLKLHPQELGELRMEIEVKQDNIKAHITTQNPQAQEALDRHLPRLREALAQQGLELAQVEISVAASDEYDGQRFQDNLERHRFAQTLRGKPGSPAFAVTAEEGSNDMTDEQQSLNVTI